MAPHTRHKPLRVTIPAAQAAAPGQGYEIPQRRKQSSRQQW